MDSAKIKVPFYTTDINILRVASMHRIVIHHIDISMNRYTTRCHMDYFTDLLATFLDLDCVRTLAVYEGSESSQDA